MFETIAERLQTMFAPSVPIVHSRAEAKQPFLLHLNWGSGDIYSGGSNNHTIHLELERTETGLLRIIFQYALHELSGQCDEWYLSVTGATEAERQPLWELFHPRQQTSHWNNHVRPTFDFNGTRSVYR